MTSTDAPVRDILTAAWLMTKILRVTLLPLKGIIEEYMVLPSNYKKG